MRFDTADIDGNPTHPDTDEAFQSKKFHLITVVVSKICLNLYKVGPPTSYKYIGWNNSTYRGEITPVIHL